MFPERKITPPRVDRRHDRQEFSKRTKELAYERADGRCECCGARLAPGRIHYDHIIADGLGGEPTLTNCACVCVACHAEKTREDVRRIAKGRRIQLKNAGIKRRGRTIAGRKFDGTPIPSRWRD